MESRIDEMIEASGLKKSHLAKKLGVNHDTLTNWAKGRSFPKLDKAAELAELLGCSIDDLIKKRP